MTDIEGHLKSLEVKNARLWMMMWALTGIIAVGVLFGAALPEKADHQHNKEKVSDEVRAKRLVIVDDDGNERLVLEVAEKKFNNEMKADDRKEVFATIRLTDSEGVERASLDANDSGWARLKLFSKEGKRRIEMATSGEDYAKLLVYDKHGELTESKFP